MICWTVLTVGGSTMVRQDVCAAHLKTLYQN
jgi:hypothetical protein